MFRGLLIVVITLVALIATVVGVVRAGLHRMAVAQRQADANWHRPDPGPAPTTQPFAAALPAADLQEAAIPTFLSIDLWAKDASMHGNIQLIDPKTGKARSDVQPPVDGKALIRWQGRQRMGGRVIMTYLTGFGGNDDYVEWPVSVPKAGDYEVDLTYACPPPQAGGRFTIKIADKEASLTIEETRNDTSFRVVPVGRLTLAAGNTTLSVRGAPTSIKSRCFMNLRSIEIIPATTSP